MNLPASLYAIRWLIRDTFRQARSNGVFWWLLGVNGLFIAFCLSVSVEGGPPLHRPNDQPDFLPAHTTVPAEKAAREGVDVVSGQLLLAFGAVRVELGRDREDAVRLLQLLLAGVVADSAGILLVLVWTAGFLPTFLEPGSVAVLLAKPVPRWSLLVGKFIGVLGFVAFQVSVFVLGTWAALGLRTGYWAPNYVLCLPVLFAHFAVFFSFSTLIAVMSRSTVSCVFVSLVFWFMCWGMNYGRHVLVAMPQMEGATFALGGLVEAGYWILPKPADMGILLYDILQAGHHFGKDMTFQMVQNQGKFYADASLLSSLTFAALMLYVAGKQFVAIDY